MKLPYLEKTNSNQNNVFMKDEAVEKGATDQTSDEVLLTDAFQRQNSRKRISWAIYHDKKDMKQSGGCLQEMREVEGSYHSDTQVWLQKPQKLKPWPYRSLKSKMFACVWLTACLLLSSCFLQLNAQKVENNSLVFSNFMRSHVF